MPAYTVQNRNHLADNLVRACLFGISLILTACGGSEHGSSAVQGALPNTATPAAVVISAPASPSVRATVVPQAVPVKLAYMLAADITAQSAKHRRLQYISPSNTSLSISVTPLGGSASVYGPSACTSGTCAINFTANPGPNTIAFTLTDGSSNVLSQFSTTTIVQPSTLNTFNFTANPVVNSVALSLASSSVNAGTATNDLLTVAAKDIDGNTIVGSGNYLDTNGDAVALQLNVTNSQAGGSGTVTLQGPPRVTGPGQAAIYAHYDGQWLDHTDISVSSTSSAITSLTGTTLTTIPSIQEFTIPTASSGPQEITAGPDGNLWFTEYSKNKIGRITTNGIITEFSASGNPWAIVTGADGNLWFTERGANKVGRMTTSGSFTDFALTANPVGIGVGPDGNVYVAELSAYKFARVSTTGVISEFSIGVSPSDNVITGPDGNLWSASYIGNSVASTTLSGTSKVYSATAGGNPNVIAVGPDGNLWFTATNGTTVSRITPSGTLTNYTPPTGSSHTCGIVAGPDGNMWFMERTGNNIGRITMAGVITEYALPTASAGPYYIALGADKNLWFVEPAVNKIGKFVL